MHALPFQIKLWCSLMVRSTHLEQCFGKLKAPLRRAGERSIPGLWDPIGNYPQLLHTRRLWVKLKGCCYKCPRAPLRGDKLLYIRGDNVNECFDPARKSITAVAVKNVRSFNCYIERQVSCRCS